MCATFVVSGQWALALASARNDGNRAGVTAVIDGKHGEAGALGDRCDEQHARSYAIVRPALARMFWPVMAAASGETRRAMSPS